VSNGGPSVRSFVPERARTAPPASPGRLAATPAHVAEGVERRLHLGPAQRLHRPDALPLELGRLQLLLYQVDPLDQGHGIDAGLDRCVQAASPLLRRGHGLVRRRAPRGGGPSGAGVE
jgi:hypothetical protein